LRERILLVAISRGIEFTTGQPETWKQQIRRLVEKEKGFTPRGGVESPVTRTRLRLAVGLDIPVGTTSGNKITRARRSALGNALDPRVAAIAIQRILYWRSLEK
jgi:DNA (cytosine-5)-methyltransferase 1